MSILGNRVVRIEDPKLLTGGGTLHRRPRPGGRPFVTYVRSPMAHARIVGIDIADALAAPGVVGGVHRRRPRPRAVPARHLHAARRRCRVRSSPATSSASSASPSPRCSPRSATRAKTPPSWWWSTTSRCPSSSIPTSRWPARSCSSPRRGPTCASRSRARGCRSTSCEVVVEAAHRQPEGRAVPARGPGGAPPWEGGQLVHWSSSQGAHPVPRPLVPGVRAAGRPGAGDHARRGRRLRRQGLLLPRGAAVPVAGPAPRPPGALVRDPQREHARARPRPGPDAGREDRRHPRRQGPGLPADGACRTPAPTPGCRPSCRSSPA